ncbi:MAG: beta-propeller fold lactonase family protein [Acidiferrobacterales bacterium]
MKGRLRTLLPLLKVPNNPMKLLSSPGLASLMMISLMAANGCCGSALAENASQSANAGATYTTAAPASPAENGRVETKGTGGVDANNAVGVRVTSLDRPEYLYSANDDFISSYRINAVTGALTLIKDTTRDVDMLEPVAVATNPAGTFAYALNQGAGGVLVYRINATTGELTKIPGSLVATGKNPHSITINPAGTFAYVTNYDGWYGRGGFTSNGDAAGDGYRSGSMTAYRINATTGSLTQVAGGASATGREPGSIAITPSGTFAYVTNNGSSNVSAYRISATTGVLTPVEGSPFAAPENPAAITVSPAGTIAYVVSAGAYLSIGTVSAYRINASTGALTPVAGSAITAGKAPKAITINSAGTFAYVANSLDNTITAYHVDSTTGALSPVTGSPFAAGGMAHSIRINSTGDFAYVANNNNQGSISAYRINHTTGALIPVTSNPVYAGQRPNSITLNPAGTIAYVTNTGSALISVFNVDDTSGLLVPSSDRPFTTEQGPQSIAFNPAGTFAYVLAGDVSAFHINPDTGEHTQVGGWVPVGEYCASVTMNPTSNFIYVVHSASGENTRYDSTYSSAGTISAYKINTDTGAITEVTGSPFAAGSGPSSLTINPAGTFAYVVNDDNTISAYGINGSTGALSPVTGSPFATGASPQYMVINSAGTVAYVANKGTIWAYNINPATGALTPVADSPFATGHGQNWGIAINPAGTFAYAANWDDYSVSAYRINAISGDLTQIGTFSTGSSPQTMAPNPQSIAINRAGTFAYVANWGGDSVSTYRINATTGELTLVTGNPYAIDGWPSSIAFARP